MEGIVHKQLFIISPPIPSHYYTHCWKFIGEKKSKKHKQRGAMEGIIHKQFLIITHVTLPRPLLENHKGKKTKKSFGCGKLFPEELRLRRRNKEVKKVRASSIYIA